MTDIEKYTCLYYHVTMDEMRGKSTLRIHTEPRQVIMYMTYISSDISTGELGLRYNRSQSSTFKAIQTASNLLAYDKEFRMNYREIESKINPGIWIKELGKVKEI
jgi:chromosomal replication initiation ATPase DnaA